jgi:hypothetical protein
VGRCDLHSARSGRGDGAAGVGEALLGHEAAADQPLGGCGARKAPLARVGRKLPKGNGATIRNKYSVTYVHELRAREHRANAKRGAGTLRWQRRSKASGEEDDTCTEDMKGIAA